MPDDANPVSALISQKVSRAAAYKDGRLDVEFEDGSRLSVPAAPAFEAWQLVGTTGLRLVSLPGGDLAIWNAEESRGADG